MNVPWSTQLLAYSGIATLALSAGALAFLFVRKPMVQVSQLGRRGLERTLARERLPLFVFMEPVIRFVAGRLSYIGNEDQTRKLDRRLVQAGDLLGVTADEYRAIAVICGVVGALTGGVLGRLAGAPAIWPGILVAGVVGWLLPFIRLSAIAEARLLHINRAMVGAIDLAAMCMSAGLDFPGALRNCTETSGVQDDPLVKEFRWILYLLDLGHSRKDALESFAERVPTEAVGDFVAAVIQAEAQGNPISEVLQIQATMLRMRRSVAAEEAAAKAGVKMLFPMMLMFLAILLIVAAPFVLSGAGAGAP